MLVPSFSAPRNRAAVLQLRLRRLLLRPLSSQPQGGAAQWEGSWLEGGTWVVVGDGGLDFPSTDFLNMSG